MSLRTLYDEASLWMTPSGYEDGKLFSELPTDGSGDFTFSRGSNLAATRVGPTGLIEKGRENLFLQSNQFSTSPWVSSSVTLTSGQSGYDGSTDAWLLTKNGSGFRNVYQYINELGVATFTVYAKAGSTNWMRLTHGGKTAFFDLSGSGAIGVTSNGIDQTITSVGNGWFKCTLTANRTVAGQVPIYPYTAEGDASGSTDSIYIQDAQLEAGLVATDYIETGASTAQAGILEDMPRLDYSGSCPALLLEPQRSNLIGYSEYFEGWSNITNITPTSNYTNSPEGVINATRLQFTANGFTYYASAQVTGVQYTLSCYAKRNDSGTQNVGFFINGSGTIDSAWSLTNDWQRFTYTYTASNTSQRGIAGLSGADVSVYGFQIEQASYPTSYIPTYGSSVTRSSDISHISSMQSNNIVGSTDSYTIFFNISNDDGGNTADGGNSQWLKGQDSPSYSNIWTLRKQDVTDQKYHSLYYNKDSTYVFSNETINKGCFVFTTNEIKVFLDGSLNTTYSVTNSPLNLDGFRIDYGSSDRTSIEFSQLAIFPTALTDSECIALTTL